MPGEPHWLIYPSLDLFAYDGRNGDGESLHLKPPLHGSIHHHQLGDTQALHVDCGNSNHDGEATFKPKAINCFNELQAGLLERLTAEVGTVGKTWVLWGRLTRDDAAAIAIARDCYPQVALAPAADWQRDLVGSGRILGANVFELWHQSANCEAAASQHVLICLFDYGQSLKVMERLIERLLPLLLHRHKLLWLAANSRELTRKLQAEYATAGEIVALLQARAQGPTPALASLNEQLLSTLKLLHGYTRNLGDLQGNLYAIATHLHGYRRCRQQLQALDADSDLAMLRQFDRWLVKQHWRPLKQDCDRLQLGLPCLENAVKIAEGAIAIEQLKSQQQLARAMVAASASVGASAAAAVSIAPHLQPSPTSPWQNFGRSTSTFLLSLLAGAAVGWGLWRSLPRLSGRKR